MNGSKALSFGILILFLISILPININAEKTTEEISIILDSDTDLVGVAPGQKGNATFVGVVYCNLPDWDSNLIEIIVNLNSSTKQKWISSIDPPKIVFTPEGERSQEFILTVIAPVRTHPSVIEEITINGTFQERYKNNDSVQKSNNIESVHAYVYIKQFYWFDIDCDEPFKEIGKNERAVFKINITNYGNGLDVIEFEFNMWNNNDFIEKGLSIYIDKQSVSLEPNQTKTITIAIQAPSKVNMNNIYSLRLVFFSRTAKDNGENPIETTYPLYVRVKGGIQGAMNDKLLTNVGIVLGILFGIIAIISIMLIILKIKTKRKKDRL